LAGYGQSKIKASYTIAPNTASAENVYASHKGSNWFASANAFARHRYQQLLISGQLGLLYSYAANDAFSIPFTAPTTVAQLSNKTTWVMENIRLTAKQHPMIQPFVDGGLFQVPHSKNNRNGVSSAINGSLPQLNANKSGYRLGGGVTLIKVPAMLSLRYQYYKAGQVFRNNIFNATLSMVSDNI